MDYQSDQLSQLIAKRCNLVSSRFETFGSQKNLTTVKFYKTVLTLHLTNLPYDLITQKHTC